MMNEKMSKRKIQIIDLQKREIEEKRERRLLIRLHIFYLILLINLCNENMSNSSKSQGKGKTQILEILVGKGKVLGVLPSDRIVPRNQG